MRNPANPRQPSERTDGSHWPKHRDAAVAELRAEDHVSLVQSLVVAREQIASLEARIEELMGIPPVLLDVETDELLDYMLNRWSLGAAMAMNTEGPEVHQPRHRISLPEKAMTVANHMFAAGVRCAGKLPDTWREQ